MRTLYYELFKIWGRPILLAYFAGLLFVNLFFLNMSQTGAADASARSYRALSADMNGLSATQQQEFLAQKLTLTTALQGIDYMYQVGRTKFSAQDQILLRDYGAQYAAREYQLYCDDFHSELRFLTAAKKECDASAQYQEYLDNICQQSEGIRSFSVFSKGKDDYVLRSNQAIAAAYKGIDGANVRTAFYLEKGLMHALGYFMSDFVLCFSLLLLASILVRQEKDTALLSLMRTTPSGRGNTALAKLGALAFSLLPIIFTVYGSNLLFCSMRFGLGSLTRSIQSVFSLRGCVWQISVWQYIFIFVITKWIAYFILGTVVMLCLLTAKQLLTGCIAAASILGVGLFLTTAISAASPLNVLKYANFAGILKTNELLGAYRTLYWFGNPISLSSVILVCGGLLLCCCTIMFFLMMERAQLIATPQKANPFRLPAKPTTVLRTECRKLFFHGGAGIVLMLMLMWTAWQTTSSTRYLTQRDIVYNDYMRNLSGPYTAQTAEKLNAYNEEFKDLYKLDQLYQNGKITEDTYYLQTALYANLSFKRTVFQDICSRKLSYLKENPGAWLVNEKPYEQLLSGSSQRDLQDALLITLVSILCFAGFMSLEYTTGMAVVLQATPLGRSATIHAKYRIMVAVQSIVACVSTIPHFYCVLQDYGLPSLFAPAMSLELFCKLPAAIPIFFVVALLPLIRVVGCIALGTIVLCVSQRVKNALFSAFLCSTLFGLPILLAISGMSEFEWISIYPLFHATAMFASGALIAFSLLWLVFASISIWAGNFYLYDSWDVQ